MFTIFSVIPTLMLFSSLSFAAEPTAVMVESEEAKLFTLIFPKENAETIILLHGGPGVPMDFLPLVGLLSKKYQVITFDQRGTSRSPMTGDDYSMEAYIRDLNSIVRHFKLSSFHLFGHSWGGLYAQLYAEKFPEKISSLFLSSSASGTGEHWKQTEGEVMAFNKSKTTGWQWLVMGIRSLRGILGSDTAYQAMFKQVINNYNKDFDESFSASDAMVEYVQAKPINKTRQYILDHPLLSSPVFYDFPVLLQYGEKDIYGESKQHVIERFPAAKLITIKNSGHLAWLNNANEFQITLVDFYRMNDI